jgi:hypothetical protein
METPILPTTSLDSTHGSSLSADANDSDREADFTSSRDFRQQISIRFVSMPFASLP